MARETNKLSATRVSSVKTPGRYCDGLGLWLQVAEGGTKSWLFRYTLHGRARQMGLGALHTVSLKEARERAKQARQIILDGEDPIEVKHRRRDEARAQTADRMLFKDAVARFLEVHNDTWRNAKHRQQWANTLKSYALPTLGNRPMSAIDGALINDALASIWTKKPETARRTKQRIERVIQWVREGKPLPRKSAAHQVQHQPAMQVADLPEFMVELRAKESISARALEFTVLTVARTSDTIRAKWADIDLDAGVWAIPEHKTGKQFEIPLPKSALEIIKALPRERGNQHVFVGAKKGQGLSNQAMSELLKGMHADRAKAGFAAWTDRVSGRLAVPHGFRSTFRDWAGDFTNFPREVIETAMSHKIKDRVEAAYRRSSALEKRRKLMELWAKHCASTPRVAAANVVALHG